MNHESSSDDAAWLRVLRPQSVPRGDGTAGETIIQIPVRMPQTRTRRANREFLSGFNWQNLSTSRLLK